MENGQLIEWLTYCIYLKIWLSTAMWVYQRVALREHQASTTCSCVVEPLLIVLASKEIDKALLLELRIVHMHPRGYSFFSISQLILMARIFSKVHGWSINNINMIMSYYANCHNNYKMLQVGLCLPQRIFGICTWFFQCFRQHVLSKMLKTNQELGPQLNMSMWSSWWWLRLGS